MFFILLNECTAALYSETSIFDNKIHIIFAESQNGRILVFIVSIGLYRFDAFFLALSTITLPLSLIFPTIFVCIIYYLVGFDPGASRFFGFLGIILLSTNTAAALGQVISATTGSFSIASSMTITIIIPFVLLGGFYIVGTNIMWWIGWIRYISLFYYAYKLLIFNQFNNIVLECPPPPEACPFPDEHAIYEVYDVQEWGISISISILFVLNIVFRITALICFELRCYSEMFK